MLKLPEIKKMLKKEVGDNCLWLVKANLVIERTTWATATVFVEIGYKQLAIATFGLMDENCQLQEKQFKAVEKYVQKEKQQLMNQYKCDIVSLYREKYINYKDELENSLYIGLNKFLNKELNIDLISIKVAQITIIAVITISII